MLEVRNCTFYRSLVIVAIVLNSKAVQFWRFGLDAGEILRFQNYLLLTDQIAANLFCTNGPVLT